MSAQHTPGPWAIDWNVSRIDVFSADAATLVATIRRSTLSAGIDDVAKANARLLVAAPDLLEALVMVRDADDDCRADGLPTMPQAARAKINAAIAKATEGAP